MILQALEYETGESTVLNIFSDIHCFFECDYMQSFVVNYKKITRVLLICLLMTDTLTSTVV